MRLEFIPFGASDCPLVRLYRFNSIEAGMLMNHMSALSDGTTTTMCLNKQSYIDSVNDCILILVAGGRNRGIEQVGQPATFQCTLTTNSWDNIAGLIEPFARAERAGFQWLDRTSEISLLLSSEGAW
jgi:hypothetical protein